MIYNINKEFKVNMLETIKINGLKYYFRLLTISDKRIYLEAFNKLSMASKKYRFHQFKKSLTEKEINYFLDIDNHDHLAIGATIKIIDKEYGVGLIRYIREKSTSNFAEVGLTILDSFQHKGLGTVLYKKMMNQAKNHGISTLINHVLNDNDLMINLLNKFDGILSKKLYDGTSIIKVSV